MFESKDGRKVMRALMATLTSAMGWNRALNDKGTYVSLNLRSATILSADD